jgi:Mor family transcriptional regulator
LRRQAVIDLWDDVREDDFGDDDAMGALVAVVGLSTAKRLVEAFGGDVLYIPKPESVIRSTRNRRIVHEFRAGADYRALSERYRLTTRRIRHIVDTMAGGRPA